MNLKELSQIFLSFAENGKWEIVPVIYQHDSVSDRTLDLPIFALVTKKRGEALWILSGIHGEEPAGPNAIAEAKSAIQKLATQDIPMVILPLCNPKGYRNNWRYPNTPDRDWRGGGYSVGDSEHYLHSLFDPSKARTQKAVGDDTAALTQFVVNTFKLYPPALVIDFHEDELSDGGYIYSQGILPNENPVALKIVSLLKGTTIPLRLSGDTRFGEPIHDGVISSDKDGKPLIDGSIDELLASEKIIVDGKETFGPRAKTVIVVETPAGKKLKLEERKNAHITILNHLNELWEINKTH